MAPFISFKTNNPRQYFLGVFIVTGVAAICFGLSAYIGYRVVALILLVTISLIAMVFDIMPVLVAAVLSAIIWDFFFIPPHFTMAVHSAEDALMLAMYFIIALLNGVLTYKIRQMEKEASKKEEKENALKLYGTLLNSLSHELRTPISTIIGSTDNLLSNSAKLTEENKKELLTEVSDASLRLNRQVENLLNMSRLESGYVQLKKDWCDVNELIYGIVNQLEDLLKKHPLNIQIKNNLPLFKLDYGLMEQVLYNLVYNAAIYTPDYCIIGIKAGCVDDKLILTVEDTGNGFPDDELERVFDKFYRLKNSKTGGTGLGLSIVKGFVEAHGGTITLENSIDSGGAVFRMEIPTEVSYLNNLKNE